MAPPLRVPAPPPAVVARKGAGGDDQPCAASPFFPCPALAACGCPVVPRTALMVRRGALVVGVDSWDGLPCAVLPWCGDAAHRPTVCRAAGVCSLERSMLGFVCGIDAFIVSVLSGLLGTTRAFVI